MGARLYLLYDTEGVVVILSQGGCTHEGEDRHDPLQYLSSPQLAHCSKKLIDCIVKARVCTTCVDKEGTLTPTFTTPSNNQQSTSHRLDDQLGIVHRLERIRHLLVVQQACCDCRQ